MTEIDETTDSTTILVEFDDIRMTGVRPVSRGPGGRVTEELLAKSQQALDSAMRTIQAMAHRVTETVKEIKVAERPDEVEVAFGLKLDAEAGAYLAKAGTEASVAVTLTWKHEDVKRDSGENE